MHGKHEEKYNIFQYVTDAGHYDNTPQGAAVWVLVSTIPTVWILVALRFTSRLAVLVFTVSKERGILVVQPSQGLFWPFLDSRVR